MLIRRLCNAVVRYFGPSWPSIGWTVFLCWLWVPGIFHSPALYAILTWSLDALLIAWLNIDMVDQRVSGGFQALIGILIFVGFLPHWFLLTVIVWLYYWTNVRASHF